MADPRDLIIDTLRGRVIRGIQSRTLRPGDRLPSAPELAVEFDVDHRLVIAAYKQLAHEGLVDRRPRGGVYIAARPADREGMPPLPEAWFAEVLLQGLSRELPAPDLHEWMRRCVETLRLRAVVVTATPDQGYGLCRELRDDFGLEATSLLVDEVRDVDALPLALRRADLLLTSRADEEWMRALATTLRKELVVFRVRAELLGGEWALLLRRPVYVVVATPEFGVMLRDFYKNVPGIENLHIMVHGRDDLHDIPPDAPTYVTQRVRAHLGNETVPGRILPPARTMAPESAREIFTYIVRANIEAFSALSR